jgi:predicted transcriptional regulator
MAVENHRLNQKPIGELSTDSKEIIALLVSLGVDENTSRTLLCLHVHGSSTSSQLQKRCNLRQPDVSVSINQLSKLGVVDIVSTTSNGRGRPSHVYQLSLPLNEALLPFRASSTEIKFDSR